jgi:hypothetical protein
MWINKQLFDMIVADNKEQQVLLRSTYVLNAEVSRECDVFRAQKVRDDSSIDWLRHRVNALEKQNTILMGKATGLFFPTPEIVPTRPGTMGGVPDFDQLPSFNDVGDDEATRLGIGHDLDGHLKYTK